MLKHYTHTHLPSQHKNLTGHHQTLTTVLSPQAGLVHLGGGFPREGGLERDCQIASLNAPVIESRDLLLAVLRYPSAKHLESNLTNRMQSSRMIETGACHVIYIDTHLISNIRIFEYFRT